MLRVILMRQRVTKVHQDAISGVLGDVSAEAFDRFGCILMVARDELAPILWIELGGNFSRTCQIAEKNCYVTPFTLNAGGIERRASPGLLQRRSANRLC